MKLYYSPGACSLSPHIVLLEAGLPFTSEKVDLKSKKTSAGVDFLTVNSKGTVPTLQLDDGQVLTEGPAIVQYLADLKPDSGLAPRAGTFERYRLMEALNYISSELHKSFGPLFNPASTADAKKAALDTLGKKFDWLSGHLGSKNFLVGDRFTVRGRVPVHGARLVRTRGARSSKMAGARRLSRAHRPSSESAGSAQGRGPDQVRPGPANAPRRPALRSRLPRTAAMRAARKADIAAAVRHGFPPRSCARDPSRRCDPP